MDIVFEKGAIDNLVKKLGIKKTEIYRKEEGAVISNKTMKLINDGEHVSFNTYLKLQKKYNLQQGVDILFEYKYKRSFFHKNIFTTSYPKSLYDEKFETAIKESGCKSEYEYNMGPRWEDKEEYYQDPLMWKVKEDTHIGFDNYSFSESLERFKGKKLSKNYISEAQKKLHLYAYYIYLALRKHEFESMYFDDDRTLTNFYFVENPEKFYRYLLANNTEEFNNEWLIDHDAVLSAKCDLDEEEKFQLIKKYNPNSELKIDKVFFKKILKQVASQDIKKTLKTLTDIIDNTKKINHNTASTNKEQILNFGEDSIENSFWLNYYILKISGLELYFKKINVTEIEKKLSTRNILNKTKFVFYISKPCHYERIKTIPVLRVMPLGYVKLIKIPDAIPDENAQDFQNFLRDGMPISTVSSRKEFYLERASNAKKVICDFLSCSEDDFYKILPYTHEEISEAFLFDII